MSNKIWAFIDQFKGQAVSSAWETIGAGRLLAEKLGGGVTVLVFGQGVESIAQQAFQFGADEVFLADDPVLADFRPEAYATTLSKLAAEHKPEVILFPTTTRGRELAAMVAIDLKSGVLPDVTALEVEGGRVIATRPVYGGKLLAKVSCQTDPQLITLRVRAFPKPAQDAGKTGTPTKVPAGVAEGDVASKVESYAKSEG